MIIHNGVLIDLSVTRDVPLLTLWKDSLEGDTGPEEQKRILLLQAVCFQNDKKEKSVRAGKFSFLS
jgi:hypothetical protein